MNDIISHQNGLSLVHKPALARGNPIEILFITRGGQEWRPATISYWDGHQIGVVFTDSSKMTVRRNASPRTWRLPR